MKLLFVEQWTLSILFHTAIDQFVRSVKEQVLYRFVFRPDKHKIRPDSEPPNQISSTLCLGDTDCIHDMNIVIPHVNYIYTQILHRLGIQLLNGN